MISKRKRIRWLIERVQGWFLRRRIASGKVKLGRESAPGRTHRKQHARRAGGKITIVGPSGSPPGVAVQGRHRITIRAVVTRADGRIEDLGIIGEGMSAPAARKNWWKGLLWQPS